MKVECSSLRKLSITDSKLVGKMNCLFQSHKYQSTVKKKGGLSTVVNQQP